MAARTPDRSAFPNHWTGRPLQAQATRCSPDVHLHGVAQVGIPGVRVVSVQYRMTRTR